MAGPAPSTYSYQQIEDLWTQNGGPASAAPLMAAIAEAESGGNPYSINNNPSTGDYSVGLWQINYFGNLLGPRTQEYGSPSALQADPSLQAKAAISLYGGGSGLSNWTTYTSGAYKKYLGGAGTAPSTLGTDTNPAGPQGGAGQVGCSTGSQGISLSLGPLSANTGIGTACQIKALTGGLAIGLGVAIMVIGGVLVFFGPRQARRLARGPVGAIIGAASSSRAPTASAQVEAPEAAEVGADDDGGYDAGYGAGFLAGQGSESTARNSRQAQREGERATDRAGLSAPGPSDRRTGSERLRGKAA